MFHQLASAFVAVPLGVLLLLPSGCDSTADDGYQTFSTKDAERVEQARDARTQDAADATERDAAQGGKTKERSPIVLAAAQAAARAARPAEDQALLADAGQTAPRAVAVENAPTAVNELDAPSLAQAAAAKVARLVAGEPVVRTPKLLVPERSFAVEGPGDALRVSYDDFDLLKVLNMEPVPPDAVEHFPKWLADLDGKPVRVRGFMYPTFQETDIPGFVLARDNQICCFGRNPKIYDLVEVTLKDRRDDRLHSGPPVRRGRHVSHRSGSGRRRTVAVVPDRRCRGGRSLDIGRYANDVPTHHVKAARDGHLACRHFGADWLSTDLGRRIPNRVEC